MDDRELEHGSSITGELPKAIEESQIALIIFSENFATSSWCLDEVVKIMDCRIQYKQMVVPVFYNVDPSTVRYQTMSFADAFKKHKRRYEDDVEGMQKLQRWRAALSAAAYLSGYSIHDRSESDCIKEIVDEISSKKLQGFPLPYLQDLVGIETHLEEVKSLLKIDEINDPLIMGIWGIGGVGKTTVARAIFDTLLCRFKAACFLADVKQNKEGIHSLQNILLNELLGEKVHRVYNKEDGKDLLARRLCKMKVLVVLDDIAHKDHLDYLAGDLRWFGNGSRIIITTRDKHLMGKKVVYEMKELPDHKAIQLFKKHAFKDEVPDESFDKLTFELVSHAKGLPLALKVWGAFLHNRVIEEWKSAIVDIKHNSDSEVVDKLKISYDGLTPTQQHIFLDIACFYRGVYKPYVVQMLESCDFKALIGLRVLIDKSLVFISKGDTVEMHDLIQDMGRYIVKMQTDAGECSRVWLADNLEVLMHSTEGTKAVEAIVLEDPPDQLFLQKALKNMNRLRMLQIKRIDLDIIDDEDPLIKDGSIEYLPNSLRCFIWDNYPWESLPANFEPKRLIHLELSNSSLCYLWVETKDMRCLRWLDLSMSDRLKQTPDFTRMPNLEYVNLAFCESLKEHFVFPPVAEGFRSLEELDLSYCYLVEGGLPKDFGCLSSLKTLDLTKNKFVHLPQCIGQLHGLRCLNLSFSKRLKELPDFTGMLNLKILDLSHCGNLEEVHHSLGYLKELTELKLYDCQSLKRFPALCIDSLTNLNLRLCFSLENFPEILGSMELELEIHMVNSVIRRYPHSIGALRQNICSDSLSRRVFSIECQYYKEKIPSWFNHQGMDDSISIKLPENWYKCDNFLGVAVCYFGIFIGPTAEFISSCEDGMTLELGLCNHSEFDSKKYKDFGNCIHFFLVPVAGLWDTSKASEETPTDHGLLRISFSEILEFGYRLLYKDELARKPLLLMRENNDNSEHHDSASMADEIQSSHSNIRGSSVFENLQQQVHSVSMSDEASRSSSKKPRTF